MGLAAAAIGIAGGVLLATSSVGTGDDCRASDDATGTFAPIGPDGDWLAQDYFDSRGISAVSIQGRCLVASARLRGGDKQRSNGEVYTDLKYVSGLPSPTVDLRGHRVRVTVDVPKGFVGERSAPNGVQVFVKDAKFRSQYSEYTNITRGGKHVITLSPSTSSPFDASKVRVIGVKFGIGGLSSDTFTGTVRVLDAQVRPALKRSAAPLANLAIPPAVFPRNARVTLRGDGFYVAGTKRFLTGGNYAPIEYGQTFGTNGYYPGGNGVSRHPNFVDASLAAFRKARVHVLRVPLVADGRAMLDTRGRVTGYNARVRADIRALLRLAKANDQKVEFTLVDFLLAGRGETVESVALRGRPEVFVDGPARAAFFRHLVRPFLREFGRDPAVFGIDCVNEPEWLVAKREGGMWEDLEPARRAVTPIPRAALNAFLGACAAAVRQTAAGLPVAAGTSLTSLPLTAAAGDYTAAHHYPSMGALTGFGAAVPTSRPWMLEEFPTSDRDYADSRKRGGPGNLSAYVSAARSLGAAGALLWSLNPRSDDDEDPDLATMAVGQLDARLRELRAWCEQHPGTLCNKP